MCLCVLDELSTRRTTESYQKIPFHSFTQMCSTRKFILHSQKFNLFAFKQVLNVVILHNSKKTHLSKKQFFFEYYSFRTRRRLLCVRIVINTNGQKLTHLKFIVCRCITNVYYKYLMDHSCFNVKIMKCAFNCTGLQLNILLFCTEFYNSA